MTALRPIAELDTHTVVNQPPVFENINLFSSDVALRRAVTHSGGGAYAQKLAHFGNEAGSAAMIETGVLANRHSPVLETFDSFGQRIDEVQFHPAYHQLMRFGFEAGIAAQPWSGAPAGHVFHSALLYMLQHVDSGTSCPMTMTYASVSALRAEPELAREWLPHILAARYDSAACPVASKAGVTIGMAMTEKQGGSDVRSSTTSAVPDAAGDGWYGLTGHKWFCSAPMCDAFLTLAVTAAGITCFLLPRWLPGGERNAGFRLMRLKDKLGDRSNASCEVEYHGALAQRVGQEGRGIATILQMVQHTRLDCAVASAGVMRAAVAQALWHAAHRTAFQRKLVDLPVMTSVLADLVVETEAATTLAFRLARAFDLGEPFARLATPLAKYWNCKRAPAVVFEAMECTGGAGYVEAGPMPRLLRQSPLNAIWEGSGNIIALDVGRSLAREPDAVEALRACLAEASGRIRAFDSWVAALDLKHGDEIFARHTVERLAIATQAALLIATESPLAEAFCALRMEHPAHTYGASAARIDTNAIVARAMPLAL